MKQEDLINYDPVTKSEFTMLYRIFSNDQEIFKISYENEKTIFWVHINFISFLEKYDYDFIKIEFDEIEFDIDVYYGKQLGE